MPYADRARAREWDAARRERNLDAGLTTKGKERTHAVDSFEQLLELQQSGANADEAAFALGIKPASIHRTLLRHGRADLWPAMSGRPNPRH